jgi:7,8-dihydropterin-6-yl-methyl-4-(beta-D-ribofuranosyl)aminobenzene 5'-phosphate synthase
MAVDTNLSQSADTLHAAGQVEVQVLVDNVTDQLSTNPDDVLSELTCLLNAGMTEWGGEAICCAHFGLSLIVSAYANGTRHTVLFDGGPEADAVERNGARLGINFGAIESVVLSHGHFDHAGGLPKALELIRAQNNGGAVPFYVNPGMFRQRADKLPNGDMLLNKDIPSIEALRRGGATVINSPEPQLLLDNFFYVSGEIPRVTAYERGLPNHMCRTEDGAAWEPDPLIMDERFLVVNVREKGLVVFTACSHAGVINVLTHAKASFPDTPLYAVMGGLHLSGPGPEQIIPHTVKDLGRFGLKMIVPGHCTGWRAVTALVNAFGEGVVVPSAVGKRYTF